MPLIGIGLVVLYGLYLLLPFWIYQQVKTNHEVMIKGFAETMNALDHLEVRLARMERAAAFPLLEEQAGAAASTEPVSTDPSPSQGP